MDKNTNLRIVLAVVIGLLIVALAALLIADAAKDDWKFSFSGSSKSLIVLAGLVLSLVRLIAGISSPRSLRIYEKAYKDEIGNAFSRSDNKKYKTKLLRSLALYNENRFGDALKLLEEVEDKCNTADDFCAVALFKALCYSELLKLYCTAYNPDTADTDLGVVLRKYFSKEEPAERASMKDSYNFVLEDLGKAEEILTRIEEMYSKQGGLTLYSSYYMTSYVAHALHARVALYMQDWKAAIYHSTKVIDSGYYALSPANEAYSSTMSYFDYMWNYDLATETLWQVGFTLTSYGGALGQSFLNFTTNYTYYYPDYVPAQWALNLYSSGDMRYNSYFATLPTGYAHGLSWPLLVKYYGNQNFIGSYLYHLE